MGNRQISTYQNQINMEEFPDQLIARMDPLFQQEFKYMGKIITDQDRQSVDKVINQLLSTEFIQQIRKDEGQDQDYDKYLKVNNEYLNERRLVYATYLMINEIQMFMVYNKTSLIINFDKNEMKEYKKQDELIAKEAIRQADFIKKQQTLKQNNFDKEFKKMETIVKDNLKKQGQKVDAQIIQQDPQLISLKQKFNQEQINIQMPDCKNDYIIQMRIIQQHFVNRFLQVFSKYSYNAVNKPEFYQRFKEYLENKYRDILLCLAKIFHVSNLFKIKSVINDKYWDKYKFIQVYADVTAKNYTKDEEKFVQCICNMLDQQASQLTMQGNIMKMTVRHKILPQQAEDLDVSIEVGVDNNIIPPQNRTIQCTNVLFIKKKSPATIIPKINNEIQITNYNNTINNNQNAQINQ